MCRRAWVLSQGQSIEIFKDVGDPARVVDRLGLPRAPARTRIGHTRMATEVRRDDRGRASVHHRRRSMPGAQRLAVEPQSPARAARARRAMRFQTENDSEVAAGYLTWRMREGDSLRERAGERRSTISTASTPSWSAREIGFGVLRDPIACKPAVMAETDAGSRSARSIARWSPCPASSTRRVWEPEPATVYAWERRRLMAARRPAPSRNSVLDLAQMTLREVHQLLHDNATRRLRCPQSARRACARRRPRRARQRRDRRPCRLLLRRHEQARARDGATAMPGTGVAENMMSGRRAREGRCLAGGRRHRLRRPAGDRRQCVGALRHLDEGHRHRGEGLGRAHVGLHGAGRQPGGARRCRRGARRLDLRGAALRARQR